MSYGSKQSDLRAAQSEKDRAAVRVSMPVKVLAFYPKSMTVDVQPLVKESIDGEYASAAPLMGLRAACLCAGDYVIRPWYKRGDIGWIIVSDFDADAALQTGQEAEPNTERNHAPEDSLFIGGVCPAGQAPSGLPDDALVLAAGGTYLSISSSGISIQGDVQITGTLSAPGFSVVRGGIDITGAAVLHGSLDVPDGHVGAGSLMVTEAAEIGALSARSLQLEGGAEIGGHLSASGVELTTHTHEYGDGQSTAGPK